MGLLFVNVLTLNGKWIWYEWSSGMTKCWIIDIMMLGCTDLNTLAALSPSPWDMHQWPNELESNLNKSLQCGKDVPPKLHKLVVLERVGVAAATSSWGRFFTLIWNYLKGALRCFRLIFIMIFLGHHIPRLVELTETIHFHFAQGTFRFGRFTDFIGSEGFTIAVHYRSAHNGTFVEIKPI